MVLPPLGAVPIGEATRAVVQYRKYREKMKLKMRKRRGGLAPTGARD